MRLIASNWQGTHSIKTTVNAMMLFIHLPVPKETIKNPKKLQLESAQEKGELAVSVLCLGQPAHQPAAAFELTIACASRSLLDSEI